MLLHAEGGEGGGGGANHRRSPTGARTPSCPRTPLAEKRPEEKEAVSAQRRKEVN